MIKHESNAQNRLFDFDSPFEQLSTDNRWVEMAKALPWDQLVSVYFTKMDAYQGRPGIKGRIVLGAAIIQRTLNLTDAETIQQIQENPYMQYFCGLEKFIYTPIFDASLLVTIRKRLGPDLINNLSLELLRSKASLNDTESTVGLPSPASCIDITIEEQPTTPPKDTDTATPPADTDTATTPPKDTDTATPEDTDAATPPGDTDTTTPPEDTTTTATPKNSDATTSNLVTLPPAESFLKKGRLILDATVAEQAIAYPTDLDLAAKARKLTERIIDTLHRKGEPKPRTYRKAAHKLYIAAVCSKKTQGKDWRKALKKQLSYVRRNLQTINRMIAAYPQRTLPKWLRKRLLTIRAFLAQQTFRLESDKNRITERIVSLEQNWVRPIKRGKRYPQTEFGAKISIAVNHNRFTFVDKISFKAFHEGNELIGQVQNYYCRTGYYPETVIADQIYDTYANEQWLQDRGIQFIRKKKGKKGKATTEKKDKKKAQNEKEQLKIRNQVEGKFGETKSRHGLDKLRTRTPETTQAAIGLCFFVANIKVFMKAPCWLLLLGLILALFVPKARLNRPLYAA